MPKRNRQLRVRPEPAKVTNPSQAGITTGTVERFMASDAVPHPFRMPSVAVGVIPANDKIAMDGVMADQYSYAAQGMLFNDGLMFMGYPELAAMAQRTEYRKPAEIIAKEMTRKWLKFQCTGDDDKSDKINQIEAEFKRLNVQAKFREAVEQDGLFGRSQIYIDTGSTDNVPELRTPLIADKSKVAKGGIKRLTVVEPMWTYPSQYNSTDPLKADYFKPQSWYVMGKEVHGSRLITLITREVPDILKPAYSFGGLSLTQICKPYVDNWLRTRQSVSDLLHSFSVSGIKTNMSSVLNGGDGLDTLNRAKLFASMRDNRGMLVIDKDTEEFFNVSTPLSGLDHLQAQAQEQMASAAGIPMVVLLKITPTGLNTSSDGEIRTFNDWMAAQQEQLNPLVQRLSDLVQVSLFGEIDEEITFEWVPLGEQDEQLAATIRKTDADTDAVYINAGVISPLQVAQRLAASKDSLYAGLDVADMPNVDEGDDETAEAE